MRAKDLKPGDRVFTQGGNEVQFVGTTPQGRIVVVSVLEVGEGSEAFGGAFEVGEVFNAPPTERKSAEVEKLNKAYAELLKKIEEARAEEEQIRKEASQRRAKLSQNKAAARVADFIEGRITHLVIVSGSTVTVRPLSEALNSNETGYDPKLRLVTLFGRSGGDLQWEINRWSDGSGSSDRCIPCCSLEEAKAEAESEIASKLGEWKSHDRFSLDYLIRSARQIGVGVPVWALEAQRSKNIEDQKKLVEKGKAALEAEQQKLDSLLRQGGASE